MNNTTIFALILIFTANVHAQHIESDANTLLTQFRLPYGISNVRYFTDLDKDGDPDLLKYSINDTISVMWIDDDDDMQENDLEGDMDNDCLMIDLNNDGEYAGELDLVLDWNDENNDGKADLQVLIENSEKDYHGKWKSHYMYLIDTDNDNIMNYIDWSSFKFEGWDREGRSNFFQDYHGQSIMLKAHINTYSIQDLRFNWENPFLFYDIDSDSYTEVAIRLVDEPYLAKTERRPQDNFVFSGMISLAQMSFDLDNDNGAANELDFDMSLKFSGKGFNYEDQVHKFESLRGLPESDELFSDPRWRQMNELVYCDHESAWPAIFNKGEWEECWLVFDEDDDCQRWERVEFYDPLDPFSSGSHKGGLDNNPQADVTGDRGEWDMDYSGKGNLYISEFDGKIHLYGAEKGFWRIDQFASYFQGWQGWRGKNIQPEDLINSEPEVYPTIGYLDSDKNGFFDKIMYDLNGDKEWEEIVSLHELGINDSSSIIDTKELEYKDLSKVFSNAAEKNWNNSLEAIKVAKSFGINISWYSFFMHPKSINQKYSYGFWLTYYIFNDLKSYCKHKQDAELLKKIYTAYYSSNWRLILD